MVKKAKDAGTSTGKSPRKAAVPPITSGKPVRLDQSGWRFHAGPQPTAQKLPKQGRRGRA